MDLPIKYTTPKAVRRVIGELQQKKAPGYYLMTSKMLKMLPNKYTLYTADIPEAENVTVTTFADDTASLSVSENNIKASEKLQSQFDEIQIWSQKWRIKYNTLKSSPVTFTMRRANCPLLTLNNEIIPQGDDVKYVELYIGRRLTWKNTC
ncbi:hypothetical protein PGB90_006684 [Kerria lacca]